MAIVNVFWEEAIKQVREDYINDSREEDFQWWIAKINFIESQGTTIYVSVPSKFVKDQLDARGHTSYIENIFLFFIHYFRLKDFQCFIFLFLFLD